MDDWQRNARSQMFIVMYNNTRHTLPTEITLKQILFRPADSEQEACDL